MSHTSTPSVDQDIFARKNVDFFNYHAVGLLEKLGNFSPTEAEINLVEKFLINISAAIRINKSNK